MTPDVGLGTEGSVQRGWGLWLTSVLAVLIATLFVFARLVQRRVKRSGFGIDDYMIIAALIASGLLSLTECQGKPALLYSHGLQPIDEQQLWCTATGDIGTPCHPILV